MKRPTPRRRFRPSRWRTWLRARSPGVLAPLLAKPADCGDHDWYVRSNAVDVCKHCLAERPHEAWDTLRVGLDFGTGTGYRVMLEVGLSLEAARDAGISASTEIQLVTTTDGARQMAVDLREAADRADAQNLEHGLPRGDGPSPGVT